MARDGMADLIVQLRGMCDAGTADYSSGASVWWTDDQLQDVLDGHRRDIKREPLMLSPDAVVSSTVYQDYFFRHEDVEGTASGTTAWVVQDSTGSAVAGTLYEVNMRARHIRFDANTRGTAYYLSYRSYDLERAAAEVWEAKAGQVSSRYDIATDNHRLTRSQWFDHCMKMAELHRRRAPARLVPRVRSDVNPAGW